MSDLCFTGNVVIEGLEMTLRGMLFDAACQSLTTGPLTVGKESRKSELKVNRK